VVVIVAVRFPVKDVECLVRERFLAPWVIGNASRKTTEKTHMAVVTVKAVAVIFPLELPI
jgi:hypothetical protein